jgi:arginine/lysine/ornithine decarboxylase
MSGSEMAEYLQRNRIECEYADIHDLVLMITPKNKNRDLTRLKKALTSLAGKRPALKREYPVLPLPQKVCSIRQAVFAPSVRIPIKEAEGRICAAPSISCPPAVPVAVSGELLTNEILDVMKWYGISDIEVIDD